jgi:aminopeptidase-like protein
MSENDKKNLPDGKYHITIGASKGPGTLELADLIIKYRSNQRSTN